MANLITPVEEHMFGPTSGVVLRYSVQQDHIARLRPKKFLAVKGKCYPKLLKLNLIITSSKHVSSLLHGFDFCHNFLVLFSFSFWRPQNGHQLPAVLLKLLIYIFYFRHYCRLGSTSQQGKLFLDQYYIANWKSYLVSSLQDSYAWKNWCGFNWYWVYLSIKEYFFGLYVYLLR